jgi:hypothetical protein
MINLANIKVVLKKIYFYFCISKYNFFFKKKIIFQQSNFTHLKKILYNKKIALVGNSPELLKTNNYIDSYDIVIRLNILPKKKDYDKLGKRCDILMLSTGPISLINENFIKI